MTGDEFEDQVRATLAAPFRRVRSFELEDGRRFWLKRTERLHGRMRAQKGDPRRAFAAERRGLRFLAAAGLPVPAIEAEGEDWLVLPDAGPVLAAIPGDPALTDADKRNAFEAAGRALARLHWAGMSHGRPAVRDICWDGREARFIDLERFRQGRRAGWRQAADVAILTQTAYAQWPDDPRWIDAALETYAASAPPDAMARVRRLVRILAPLGWLDGALVRLGAERREFRATGLALARLRRA